MGDEEVNIRIRDLTGRLIYQSIMHVGKKHVASAYTRLEFGDFCCRIPNCSGSEGGKGACGVGGVLIAQIIPDLE